MTIKLRGGFCEYVRVFGDVMSKQGRCNQNGVAVFVERVRKGVVNRQLGCCVWRVKASGLVNRRGVGVANACERFE